jgi:predicted nucleic acid-binding protein
MLEIVAHADLVLIDTSAWIEFFRGSAHPVAALVDRLIFDDRVALSGVVRAELLQGARSDAQKATLGRQLAATTLLPDPPDLWDRVADLGYTLRRKGFDVRIPDLAIAVVAQAHDVPLLSLDAHFEAIAGVSTLRRLDI